MPTGEIQFFFVKRKGSYKYESTSEITEPNIPITTIPAMLTFVISIISSISGMVARLSTRANLQNKSTPIIKCPQVLMSRTYTFIYVQANVFALILFLFPLMKLKSAWLLAHARAHCV